jgi:toxin ParE1/3/4
VKLAAPAKRDITEVLSWTARTFGERQAARYEAALQAVLVAVADDPHRAGVRPRDELGRGLRTLHMRNAGQRGRHFVLFKMTGRRIDILRVLHDSMDLKRHAPPASDEPL